MKLMRATLSLVYLLWFFIPGKTSAEIPGETKPGQPNIIIIYTDDQGYADLDIQGYEQDVRTPHIDELARNGVRFTDGYVTAPQCMPSRAGLIAGRHQNRFGMDQNGNWPFPYDEYTIPERLRDVGYVTGMVGKWHLAHNKNHPIPGRRPLDVNHLSYRHGFDEYWEGPMGYYYASHTLAGEPIPNAPVIVDDNRFRIDVQTEAALSFLGRRGKDGKPFFLYLAYFAPHVPLQATEQYLARFPKVQNSKRRTALAMISAMDDGVGKIRAALTELNMRENTLIFFMSDNGAPLTRNAWDGSLNTPLIGEKGMLTDGGVRVPFVAEWPGVIPGGMVYREMVSSLDIGATAVALAQASSNKRVEGVNLIPYLTGEKNGAPHQALFWRWRSQAAIREDNWKFIRLGDKKKYLFDLSTPEAETRNLIADNTAIALRLEQRLETWSLELAKPGLPDKVIWPDAAFFKQHVDTDITLPPRSTKTSIDRGDHKPASRKTPPSNPALDPIHDGWVIRRAATRIQQSTLTMDAVPGQPAMFLALTPLNLTPPVQVRLRARIFGGDHVRWSWRTRSSKLDFISPAEATLALQQGNTWREKSFTLNSDVPVIHLRLRPDPASQTFELDWIQIEDADGQKLSYEFIDTMEK